MLRYVRKYFILYYAVALVPAVIYLATVFFSVGIEGFGSGWTWVATGILVVACTLVASRVMNRAAASEVKSIMQIFYQRCEPYLFLNRGSGIASRIKAPYNEWGSLFMSAYALALIDIGQKEEAQKAIEDMRISAQATQKPLEAAHICLNMHAPIKELYETNLALQCLVEAESLLERCPHNADYDEAKEYINHERTFDIAEQYADDQEIIKLYGELRANEKLFKRMRVQAAYVMAEAYGRLRERALEKESLEYVVQNGKNLSVVAKAQARLDEFPESREVLTATTEEGEE